MVHLVEPIIFILTIPRLTLKVSRRKPCNINPLLIQNINKTIQWFNNKQFQKKIRIRDVAYFLLTEVFLYWSRIRMKRFRMFQHANMLF